jgi:hypothetical protein
VGRWYGEGEGWGAGWDRVREVQAGKSARSGQEWSGRHGQVTWGLRALQTTLFQPERTTNTEPSMRASSERAITIHYTSFSLPQLHFLTFSLSRVSPLSSSHGIELTPYSFAPLSVLTRT